MAQLYTIFGGSGFVGRYVVQELARTGARLRVATRDPHKAQHLKPLAALGQLDLARLDLGRRETVEAAVRGADGVVNLVGALDESGGSFESVHVAGARGIAQAAHAAGVKALVHVSAIGADPESASAYGRSKGRGEGAVREAFPGATILRPSIVFGPEDQFVNRFAALIRGLPFMPIVAPKTRFQPIYVVDLAKAIAAAAADPGRYGGHTFELGGPQTLSMRALLEWTARAIGERPNFVEVPGSIAGGMANTVGRLPGAPLTRDQWLMLQRDNVLAEGEPGLAAFGIPPTPLEGVAGNWLVRYRKRGRFGVAA